jgi:nitrite reductase/ring-hydroxylating ferredoxin subunit
MKPDPFVRAANSRDLGGHGPFAVSADGVDLALVRTGAGWRAFQGRCPHQGALLGEGEIEGDRLVCRNHRWRFSLESGQRDGGPGCLASCPAVERDGVIFVDVSGLERAPTNPGASDPWTSSLAPGPARFSATPIRSISRRPISYSRAGRSNMARRSDSGARGLRSW